jgi:hypothetical protein
MAPRRSEKRLDRLLRVRALQLDMKRAEEIAAAQRVDTVTELARRIDRLAFEAQPRSGLSSGLALSATAHYRDRLHGSQAEANRRARLAEEVLETARRATLSAGRDHGAIEKLRDRARNLKIRDDMRKASDAPPPRRPWHDPCSD